jgi:hypothetical protein
MEKPISGKRRLNGVVLMSAALALLVILAACGKTEPAARTPTSTEAPSRAESTSPTATRITDLTKAFSFSGSLKCTATVDDGQGGTVKSTMYIKNGKIRSETAVRGMTATSIMSGDDIWSIAGGQCFHMRLSEMQAMASQFQQSGQPQPQTREEMAQTAADVDCNPATVQDSMFQAPSPCTEFSEMMKAAQAQMPSGFQYPNAG